MYIVQLAKITGVSTRAIRHYESVGLISPSTKNPPYRVYDESHIHTIKLIKMAQSADFSLREILEVISAGEKGKHHLLEQAQEKLRTREQNISTEISEREQKLRVLNQLQEQLSEFIEAY